MANANITSLPEETWKPVVGYEKFYEVSNHGRVYSLPRRILSGGRYLNRSGKMLKLKAHKAGHRYIGLYRGNGQEFEQVHRLVLEAFVGPAPDGMFGCHNDGNPFNNRVDNLRWGTPKENMRDKAVHGTNHELNKTHCPAGHLHGGKNNIPASEKIGKRSCRSCRAARNYISRKPHLKDHFKKISDDYFLQFTGTQVIDVGAQNSTSN